MTQIVSASISSIQPLLPSPQSQASSPSSPIEREAKRIKTEANPSLDKASDAPQHPALNQTTPPTEPVPSASLPEVVPSKNPQPPTLAQMTPPTAPVPSAPAPEVVPSKKPEPKEDQNPSAGHSLLRRLTLFLKKA